MVIGAGYGAATCLLARAICRANVGIFGKEAFASIDKQPVDSAIIRLELSRLATACSHAWVTAFATYGGHYRLPRPTYTVLPNASYFYASRINSTHMLRHNFHNYTVALNTTFAQPANIFLITSPAACTINIFSVLQFFHFY